MFSNLYTKNLIGPILTKVRKSKRPIDIQNARGILNDTQMGDGCVFDKVSRERFFYIFKRQILMLLEMESHV